MTLTGAGIESNPYLLYTVQDLVDTYSVNGQGVYFKVMNDIQLPFRDSRFPIPSFMGVLDGNGYKFTGLDIYLSTTDYVGLFGYIANATIKNLIVNSCNVIGRSRVGFFAGESYENVLFENVWVGYYTFASTYSQYSSTFHTAGGFIGYAYHPVTFRNCHNKGIVVKAYQTAGGFIGNGASGSIYDQCYSYPLNGNSYATSGGFGAFGSLNMQADGSTSYYNDSGNGVTDWYSGATLLSDAQFLDKTAMSDFDWTNRWGMNTDYNDGYPMPKIFLPAVIPTIIEQRSVSFNVNELSMVAVIRMITPLINSLNAEFNVNPIDMHVEALAKLFTPFIKKLEVTHSINPISISAYANLIRVIRKQIEAIYSIKPIDVEVKRTQLKKAIGDILNYMNAITFDIVTVANLEPIKFNAIVDMLENGNDVALIQYLLHDLYVKETSNNVLTINSENSINHIDNRNEVRILAYTGDSVRLQVKFKTYDGSVIDPTNVELKIYKTTITSNVLIETISLTESNKTATGEYTYDYVTPQDLDTKEINTLVYEFSGIYNGHSTLARGKISIRFV